jgi:hypothetical protein
MNARHGPTEKVLERKFPTKSPAFLRESECTKTGRYRMGTLFRPIRPIFFVKANAPEQPEQRSAIIRLRIDIFSYKP